jgi:condensin complex subunit 3
VCLPHLYPLALSNKLLSNVHLAALLNISITAQTLITILTRTRNVDMTVCRLVCGGVLLAHADPPDDTIPGTAHPHALTIAQREQIVCNRLGDREPAVCVAAGKLIGAWVDAVSVGTKKKPLLKDLLAFLSTFGFHKSTVVEDALLSVFAMHVDVSDMLEFDGAYLFSLVSHSIWAPC